jgi:hypothetical protein
MTRLVAVAGCAGAIVLFALAGPLAQGTPQPGMPTPNNVWIQNQGHAEAVPVQIQDHSPDAPAMRVQLLGPPGQVQTARQAWEYFSVTIPSGQDPVPVLNAAGADGWEATGAVLFVRGGSLLVMKRPRPQPPAPSDVALLSGQP